MIGRLYYANRLVMTAHVRQNETLRFHDLPMDIYNGGYIKYPDGHNFYPSNWARCDGTPVLFEDVPKELRVLELLDNPQSF